MIPIAGHLLLLLLFCIRISNPYYAFSLHHDHDSLAFCLSLLSPGSNISQLLYTHSTDSYSALLSSTIQNLRFDSADTLKPLLIITPSDELEVQAAVICCRNSSLLVRVRSGGHDYEGLSYRSDSPERFAVVDLAKLRAVHVNAEERTAWVQSGATLGELYYAIATKDDSLGFPAGTCPTVCAGGHFSGGGFGPLLRKYGFAADNIVDAKVVDVQGRLLERKHMGEDLFWAIRGGGGASFGIIISWQVRLVPVPRVLSLLTTHRTLGQGAIHLMEKWQHVAPKLHKDLYLRVAVIPSKTRTKAAVAEFLSFFLGNCNAMLRHLQASFQELTVDHDDCREMSWIDSVLHFAGYNDREPREILLDRTLQFKMFNKAKTDYVKYPLSASTLKRLWEQFSEEVDASLYLDPLGGRMDEISESEIPYPHRKGYIFNIQYMVKWHEDGEMASEKNLGWINRMFDYMTPHVSKNPRAAYINFRDLDIGKNIKGNTSYKNAMVWGRKYFKGNFRRLAMVKGSVDPEQLFWSEQSIPPLVLKNAVKVPSDLVSRGLFGM